MVDSVIGAKRIQRRALLLGLAAHSTALALGRLPYGGTMTLVAPLGTHALDPHSAHDPLAALFGDVVFDPLFALDRSGDPYATLAARLPESRGGRTTVRLREGLTTASGRPLDARDLEATLARAKSLGAYPLLASLETMRRSGALELDFGGIAPRDVARALSSPLTALVPRGFRAETPDGTGAFQVELGTDRVQFRRNVRAARGAALLDGLSVRQARDMSDGLRSFELGDSNAALFGAGLHRPRPGARPFAAGRVGWVTLGPGRLARSWGAPGVTQSVLDAVRPEALAPFGLTSPSRPTGTTRWGGPSGAIAVDATSAYLVALAEALARLLSPTSPLRVEPLTPDELSLRRRSGDHLLLLDFVRPLLSDATSDSLAILAASDRRLTRRPPRQLPADPRQLARTLPLGVVGSLELAGAFAPDLAGLEHWDLRRAYSTR